MVKNIRAKGILLVLVLMAGAVFAGPMASAEPPIEQLKELNPEVTLRFRLVPGPAVLHVQWSDDTGTITEITAAPPTEDKKQPFQPKHGFKPADDNQQKHTFKSEVRYRIGVNCQELTDTLRLQLSLDHGVVVSNVVPDGPAAKAGLKVHDILLVAGGKKLVMTDDLRPALDASGGAEIKFSILRKGKGQSLQIKPEKALETIHTWEPSVIVDPQDQEKMQKWLKDLGAEAVDQSMQHMRVIGPGILVPDEAEEPTLPEGVSIQIHGKGKQPVEVEVTQGKTTWRVTFKDMEKLPEEILDPLRRLFGGKPVIFGFMETPPPPKEEPLEKQLDTFEKKLLDVMIQIDQMRSKEAEKENK